MLFKLWEAIEDYFKDKPYWSSLRPAFGLASVYAVALVTVYEYVQWQYHVSPPLPLFLRSYLFRQISIGFAAVALLLYVFRTRQPADAARPSAWRRVWRAAGLKRLLVVALVVSLTLVALVRLAPARARHVRVRFMSDPGGSFDRYAVVYLLYELNKLQRHWYFDVDFDTFNPAELSSGERKACAESALCYARLVAGSQPFIGITTESLGQDSFWENDGLTSVITTQGWEDYAPPSVYEYLGHGILAQSLLIHLNAHCRGLPTGAYEPSRTAGGDLFQFTPRRHATKAEILAAHLSPSGEEMLLNCFGIEYMTTAASLLTLDWMHTKRVDENLQRAFGINLAAPAASPGDVTVGATESQAAAATRAGTSPRR